MLPDLGKGGLGCRLDLSSMHWRGAISDLFDEVSVSLLALTFV